MKKKNIIKKCISLCAALCLIISAMSVTVYAASNTTFGVKIKSFGTCIIQARSSSTATDNKGAGATKITGSTQYGAGYTEHTSGGMFGKALSSTDSVMHFSIPKYSSSYDRYYVGIRQPQASVDYAYFNFSVAFGEGGLPEDDELLWTVSYDDTSTYQNYPLIDASSYFTEANRWYNVEVMVEVTSTGYKGTLYIDGEKAGEQTNEAEITKLCAVNMCFDNTAHDSSEEGTYELYFDDAYAEYGSNAPTRITNDDIYPDEDNSFRYSRNSVVAKRSTATVKDFYDAIEAGGKTADNFAVRDDDGADYDSTSEESIVGKYIVYSSDDEYGKSGETKKYETYTSKVTAELTKISSVYGVFGTNGEGVIEDSFSTAATALKFEFSKNIKTVNSLTVNNVEAECEIEDNSVIFRLPEGLEIGDTVDVIINVTDENDDTLPFEKSFIVIEAKLEVKDLTGSVADGVCTLTASLKNTNSGSKKVTLLAVQYDKNDICKSVGSANVEVGFGTDDYKASVPLVSKAAGDYVRLLIWDSLDLEKGLHPVLLIKEGIWTYDIP